MNAWLEQNCILFTLFCFMIWGFQKMSRPTNTNDNKNWLKFDHLHFRSSVEFFLNVRVDAEISMKWLRWVQINFREYFCTHKGEITKWPKYNLAEMWTYQERLQLKELTFNSKLRFLLIDLNQKHNKLSYFVIKCHIFNQKPYKAIMFT